ncbi:hypothetical protein Fcan01_18107 [Folsomia candida]|uniref:Uncharacterized protein n=1 Tax=Folsomia candida TaxID=158441 RepID=A0A226DQA0_FOLCA|nr:hypothetical protein Fcan01_18107 [Folsomia candida]
MRPIVKQSRAATRSKIQVLHEEGYGPMQIARKLGLDRKTVWRWKNRKSICDKKRTGRPTKASPTTKNMIKSRMYRKLGSSVRKCAKALNESKRFLGKDKKLSHQTVQNFIKTTTWGKTAFKSSCKPHLSAKNISDRVRFGTFRTGNRYLTDGRRGHEKRSNILFTDETWIELCPQPHHQNLRYRTEKRSDVPPTLIPKKGLKLMVAGGFSSRGVTDLHIVPAGQTVTGNYYRTQILPIYSKALDTKLTP